MTGGGGSESVLGPLEAEIMRELWDQGTALSVRQVLDRLNRSRSRPLAYTTVMTVMGRLSDKAVLQRRRQGRAYVYEPAAPDSATIAVRAVLRDFGQAAVAPFVSEARADPALMRRLEGLLEEEE